jgi:hypothetical protein
VRTTLRQEAVLGGLDRVAEVAGEVGVMAVGTSTARHGWFWSDLGSGLGGARIEPAGFDVEYALGTILLLALPNR